MTSNLRFSLAHLVVTFFTIVLLANFTIRVAQALNCPIILDLNNDGVISTTTRASAALKIYRISDLLSFVDFDIDADGQPDRIEWVDGTGDGILVDRDKILEDRHLSGDALFGNTGEFANGFDKLSLLDKDNDGKLSGHELDRLALWVDNGDAVLQPEELKSLNDFNISSINVKPVDDESSDRLYSFATTSSNEQIYLEDVWFLNADKLNGFPGLCANLLSTIRDIFKHTSKSA
jgi:hypothetical protein